MHVRLFGDLAVSGTLATNVDTADWSIGYAVNPLTGDETETAALDRHLDEPISAREAVETAFASAMDLIRQTGYERSAEALAGKMGAELMAKHFGPPGARRRVTPDTVPAFERDFHDLLERIGPRRPSSRSAPDLEKRLNEHGKQKKST